ncbi:MAG TPA: heme ABC exporter ATP-binding protein CcmA [Solimonas sp.]|nr:heme ABC exporter ATP-binding protein CcmA [Solimonas sp.]
MAAPTPLIAVRKLALVRGTRTLFDRLDLDLRAGELLHLKGANGAGKTSLLEALAGLRPAAEGTIEAPAESESLHWIGHRNGLSAALTPMENLRFWCGINQAPADAIVPALERLGVASLRHRPCRTLSAGQKRRSSLARLLVARRPLWLLDEPLDGLDAAGLATFGNLLGEHLASGGGAVVTSHQSLPVGLLNVRTIVLGQP